MSRRKYPMKLMIASLLLLMVSGCQSVPKLTVGHHALGTPEEELLSEFLARADITVSLGYAGGHYTAGKEEIYGIDLADIEQAISAIKHKRLAVVHEQINYSTEHNDHEKAKVLSLLRAKSFDMVVITAGTGNRGGTHILKVIRKEGTQQAVPPNGPYAIQSHANLHSITPVGALNRSVKNISV
jgi:hypothetical protein